MLLRRSGIKTPIVLMEGLFTNDELIKASEENFTLIVHHALQVEMFEQNPTVKPLSIWLKIDTGMHRLGFAPDQVVSVYERLQRCQAIKKPIGLMTHFAEADSSDRGPVMRQIELFNDVTQGLQGPRSLANSAGIIAWPTTHAEWVRPGLMLYGASPFSKHTGGEYHLQPVMSLMSELIAIHDIQKGERIGYGGTFVASEPMRMGVVGVGYGDGYPQCARNGTPMLVNGQRCPLAGRVSMDMLTVDLRAEPKAKVGDPVLLWGAGLPVEESYQCV
jgi:alanine racemase